MHISSYDRSISTAMNNFSENMHHSTKEQWPGSEINKRQKETEQEKYFDYKLSPSIGSRLWMEWRCRIFVERTVEDQAAN